MPSFVAATFESSILSGFNSLGFVLLFLPVVVAIHWGALRRFGTSGGRAALLVASVVFYLLSSAATLPLLFASLVFNFFCARAVTRTDDSIRRRRILVFGLGANTALLAVVKYSRFFAGIVAALTPWHPTVPAFALPLGVSFFTLQQVIYLVDCYEQVATPLPFVEHALFISFFPYISAGPITRVADVIPQLGVRDRVRAEALATGLVRFVIGLMKKVLIAEMLGGAVEAGFAAPGSIGFIAGWTAAVSWVFQLYFDFSGYTDMALGVALMLGFKLPENFDSPLASTSLVEFWTRWHMTLTSFITTYLYTPIARSMLPVTFAKAMVSTVIAMTIAGLWHGPAWTYVLFGVFHGFGLVANHVWRRTKRRMSRPLGWALTFTFLVLTLGFFRSTSVHDALRLFAGLAGLHGLGAPSLSGLDQLVGFATTYAPLVVAFALIRRPNSGQFVATFKPSTRYVVAFGVAIVVCLIYLNSGSNKVFIYREF